MRQKLYVSEQTDFQYKLKVFLIGKAQIIL